MSDFTYGVILGMMGVTGLTVIGAGIFAYVQGNSPAQIGILAFMLVMVLSGGAVIVLQRRSQEKK